MSSFFDILYKANPKKKEKELGFLLSKAKGSMLLFYIVLLIDFDIVIKHEIKQRILLIKLHFS